MVFKKIAERNVDSPSGFCGKRASTTKLEQYFIKQKKSKHV